MGAVEIGNATVAVGGLTGWRPMPAARAAGRAGNQPRALQRPKAGAAKSGRGGHES